MLSRYSRPLIAESFFAGLLVVACMLCSCFALTGKDKSTQSSQTPNQPELQPKAVNGRWGYVDRKGTYVIPPKYFGALPFSDGLALVVTRAPSMPLGHETGEFRLAEVTYIDRTGREIRSALSIRSARSFSDGRALVIPDRLLRLTGGCATTGYLNTTGEWAIKPRFDQARDFSEGLAAVNNGGNCGIGGKWGYVDRDGQIAIPFKFIWAGPFEKGRACAGIRAGDDEVIDRTGKVIPGAKCQ